MIDKSFKNWILNNIIYIIILLVSIVYIFTAIFTIAESGKTFIEIILNSALILILGYSVTSLFDIQGIFKGGQTKDVTDIKAKHETIITLVEPYAKDLDNFCENENKINLKMTRTRFLAKAGLNYDDCFNENSSAKDFKLDYPTKPKRDKLKSKSENDLIFKKYRDDLANVKFKKKMFKKAIRVKLTQLTSNSLISNQRKDDKFNFGDTHQTYLKKSRSYGLANTLVSACVFGYYTIQLMQNFQWSYLLWNALQVVLFISFGLMKYFQAYLFMQNSFVDRTKMQIGELKKFLSQQKETIISDEYINKVAEQVSKKFEIE